MPFLCRHFIDWIACNCRGTLILEVVILKMVSARSVDRQLDTCFSNLMVSSGGGRGQAETGGAVPMLSGWKDLPMELLMRIISVAGDDRIVVVASGVCTGWRDALGWGVTNLSLSW